MVRLSNRLGCGVYSVYEMIFRCGEYVYVSKTNLSHTAGDKSVRKRNKAQDREKNVK